MSHSDSTLSTFTAADGDNLAVQYWPPQLGVPRRGVVVLVHGLGEHAGRYERLAQTLTSWGFAVHGYDQCGHGDSGGVRGRLPNTMRLIEDLYDIVDSASRRVAPGESLIVLGHSVGALVACCLVLLRDVPVDGLVLSSPAFKPYLTPLQKMFLSVLPRFAPNLTVRSPVLPEALSHDPEVVEAYRADPLVHDRISGRLAHFITEAGPRVLARAGRWKVPTLLLYGGEDCVVKPQACRQFAESAPPGLVTAHDFPHHYHEVFNELESEPVYAALRDWVEQRFPAPAAAPPRRRSPAYL
ncbi:lysophospholipase [Ramlibacter sp. AW1]|uniref:Lysophospholipase n=1 Tax=Ramlibacter aurantiacus TaxID=2801330 RepID=A0A937D5E7_9BURK|nr:alpha/beta hydrolase [Ramlibacter aurantiacus]MBL0421252.1 lysophospholipase [Ramlibacter aurantiacus]